METDKLGASKKERTSMEMKPTLDRILVKIEEVENKSAGGIYLGETKTPNYRLGTLVAKGPGKKNDDGTITPVKLEVNKKYMFTFLGGVHVSDGYRVYAESEALAEIAE